MRGRPERQEGQRLLLARPDQQDQPAPESQALLAHPDRLATQGQQDHSAPLAHPYLGQPDQQGRPAPLCMRGFPDPMGRPDLME